VEDSIQERGEELAPTLNIKGWLREAYQKQFGIMKYSMIATFLSLLVTVLCSLFVMGLSDNNLAASIAGVIASYSFYPLLVGVAYTAGGIAVLGQLKPSFRSSGGRKVLLGCILAFSGAEFLWISAYLGGQNMLFHLGVGTGTATALAHALTTSGMSLLLPPVKHLLELWAGSGT